MFCSCKYSVYIFCFLESDPVILIENSNASSVFAFAQRPFWLKTVLLFDANSNIPLSRGTRPSGYHLPLSHCIQPPFNYKAGHNSVGAHHTLPALRPSFNDETSASGGFEHFVYHYYLIIFFIPCFFFPWRCVFLRNRRLYTIVYLFIFPCCALRQQ